MDRTHEHAQTGIDEVGTGIFDLLTRTRRIEHRLRLEGERSMVTTVISVTAAAANTLGSNNDQAPRVEPIWDGPTLLLFDRPFPELRITLNKDRALEVLLMTVDQLPVLEAAVSAVLATASETYAIIDDTVVAYLNEPWIDRLHRAVARFQVLVKGIHTTTGTERKAVRKAGVALERIDVPQVGDVRDSPPSPIHHRSCHRADGRAKLALKDEHEAQAMCERFPGHLQWYRCECGFFHTAST